MKALSLLPFLLACTGYAGGEVGMQSNMLSGELGTVSVQDTPELRELSIDEHEIYLDLRVIQPGAAMMVGLTIPRRVNDLGEVEYFTNEAEMIGCSGPEDDEWEADCEPDDLIVNVEDNNGDISVEFEAGFDDCGSRPPPPETPDEPEEPGDPPQVIEGSYLI